VISLSSQRLTTGKGALGKAPYTSEFYIFRFILIFQFIFLSAKCNFDQETKPHRLNLDVGDAVIILKETTHWYYGYRQK